MPTPNHKDLVERIKADLIARGVIPHPQTTNCHSFEITGRVAWQTRAEGALLIRKSDSQNGCAPAGQTFKASHDALNYPDGFVDCLVGAGPPDNENTPAWNWTPGTHSPTDADAIPPYDLDAGLTPEPPEPTPVEPMPPMPTAWSDAERLSLEWYSEGGHALDAIYCNLLTPVGATTLRHADPGGWGNWWFHIVEEEWTVDQVVAAIKTSDEYHHAHPEG